MARTSNFANVATVTRASTKTDAGGWDFTNGGTVGTLSEYASGVAAIHPTAGLLVEEATTNEIRNPRCEGAVAGSPGTLPTNWTFSMPSITGEVIGSGTEDGWPYLDYKVAGTPTGDGFMYFEPSTQIAAVSGETWAESVNMKLVGGDLTNMDGIRVVMFERSSGGSNLGAQQSDPIAVDNTNKRYFHTATLSNGSTAYVQPALEMEWDGAGAVDFTLRIYAPQCEEKAYPTSPVFPVVSSPAATTRAEDLILVPYGAWGQTTAQTLFVHATRTANSAGYFLDLQAGSAERIDLRLVSGNIRGDVKAATNGGDDYGQTLVAVAAGADIKAAIAVAHNDLAFSATGATQNTSSAVDVPTTPNNLTIGAALDSAAAHANCYIKDIRYWPKRLTNAELEALVGN